MKTIPQWTKVMLLTFSFQFFSSLSFATSNLESGFIEIVDLQHACESQLGAITVSLEGNPDDYTYYWKHGPTDLTISGLSPGIYIFVAIDEFGCIEECSIEILLVQNCELEVVMNDGRGDCDVDVILSLRDSVSGVPFSESALEVKWADDFPSGLNRTFSKETGGTFCFTITLKNENGGCCIKEDCIVIPSDPSCDALSDTKIIVNEYHRTKSGDKQFVELLVRGDGSCEGAMDIRGFHIDDNNGMMISANAATEILNPGLIGINPGFLSFAFDSAWIAIPHGSLIVIYDENARTGNWLLSDDPYDSNQDAIYVLPANHSLLVGRNNNYDEGSQEWSYSGNLESPTWSNIELSQQVDGVQVRHPDGYLSHGISNGSSAFADSVTYPLHLSNLSSTDVNARWVDQDPHNKEHFIVSLSDSTSITLGLPNSSTNADFIQDLLVCSMEQLSLQGKPADLEEETLLQQTNKESVPGASSGPQIYAYPNPFYHQINLVLNPEVAGEALISIHDMKGQLQFQQVLLVDAEEQERSLELDQALPVGVHILSFQFPSGITRRLRLVRIE